MSASTPVQYDQRHFRFKNDSGTESSTDWVAAEDTNITSAHIALDTNVRLRIVMSEVSVSGTLGRTTGAMQLYYSLDGFATAGVIVDGASSYVRSTASPNETDGATLTGRQLTQYGSNSFVSAGFDEADGAGTSVSPVADQDYEFEPCIQFRSAEITPGVDVVSLRVQQPVSAEIDTYTVTPTYSALAASGPPVGSLPLMGAGR